MSRAAAIAHRVRLASVLALGAFAVHQLRYLAANRGEAGERLAHDGHGYLAAVLPLVAAFALAALAATVLASRLSAPRAEGRTSSRLIVYCAALLAIYGGQELIEGALSSGHPDGLAALLANGGWVALPLAFAVGVAAAAVVRALEGVESVLASVVWRVPRPLAPRSQGRRRAARRLTPLLAPLAFGLARRPPPAVAQAFR